MTLSSQETAQIDQIMFVALRRLRRRQRNNISFLPLRWNHHILFSVHYGFARKLCFLRLSQHIFWKTADNADARSRSRSSSLFCLRQNLLRSRFGAAKIFSKAKSNAKAAAKQVVSVSERQRRAAQALACICVICGFLNQFSVPLLKHNLGAKPSICICRSFSKPEIYYISDFT